jgi:hypothetical protein
MNNPPRGRLKPHYIISKINWCLLHVILTDLEGAWIPWTNFSLTYFSLFEGLKFQSPLTKERLKLVLGLKFFSQGDPY